jgi:enoyl-CoA hydratase
MGTDIRVAVPNAKFGLQEVKWGLFPAGASTVNLPQQIPYAKAMELLLTGDLISADEACSLGLINRVTSTTEDLMPTAMEIAQYSALGSRLRWPPASGCARERGRTGQNRR